MKILDLTDKTYFRLTGVMYAGFVKDGCRVWVFKCSCGNIIKVPGKLVVNGNTKSCGCLRTELRRSSKNLRHGHAKTSSRPSSPTYNSWFSMKSRCRTKTDSMYYMYGAVGIAYDPKWESFESFLVDMGERPKGTSLDRLEGIKGYSKDNCRWATPKEQVDNRVCTHKFTFEGKICTITDIANHLNIPRGRVKYYLSEKRLSIEEMLEVLSG